MYIQTYRTHCGSCGEEVESKVGVTGDENEVIVDFIEGIEFKCDCGKTTSITIDRYVG